MKERKDGEGAMDELVSPNEYQKALFHIRLAMRDEVIGKLLRRYPDRQDEVADYLTWMQQQFDVGMLHQSQLKAFVLWCERGFSAWNFPYKKFYGS